MTDLDVPQERIHPVNEREVRPDGAWVLYWMIAARRTRWSFGLQRALQWCRRLGRPLVVLEALRVDYPWASDRLHTFILQGMADNARELSGAGVAHLSWVETEPGEGRGLLAALGARACVVVTDAFPAFFLPRMVRAAGARLEVRLEQVDGNGVMPLAAPGRPFARAVDLRRWMQRSLRPHLLAFPHPAPLSEAQEARGAEIPDRILRKWAPADRERLSRTTDLPIDHAVPPSPLQGGALAAEAALARFLEHGLPRYEQARHPDADATSGLSPWLHFGHLSAHQVVAEVLEREGWTPEDLGERATGSRTGWWGVSEAAEAFLDQVVTWRELGYLACWHDDQTTWASLPEWARQTLEAHAPDARSPLPFETLDAARTGDPLWDAAQRQLREEGRIHNYLRMLWGKRVLEWSETPQQAFARLIALNDRYALDGRDPNSYSGIGWVFGRFDRAWGPERPIYGKVRYMTSESTRRKLKMRAWLHRWGART